MNRKRENWTEGLISRHLLKRKMSVVIMKEGGNSTSFNFLLYYSSLQEWRAAWPQCCTTPS